MMGARGGAQRNTTAGSHEYTSTDISYNHNNHFNLAVGPSSIRLEIANASVAGAHPSMVQGFPIMNP